MESKPAVSVVPLLQQPRNPSIFRGEAGQDPGKWLKEFERVAKYNAWGDMVCLANTYFFLEGTAKQWYENNEGRLTSWDVFNEELKRAFGDTTYYVQQAQDQLKTRAQRPGESTQSYIQNVLGLCQEAKPNMTEDEKLSHLMKGVAENVYQALVTKEIATTADFITWCRHIENMQQKRIKPHKFERLPNVVPLAAIQEQSDLTSLIRQIVREEVERILTPAATEPGAQITSIESLVHDEVIKTLAPVHNEQSPWTEVKPRRQTPYAEALRRGRPTPTTPTRKTEVWRTTDNRPVCFHCGRPGHVVRYCRERKAVFNNYWADRRGSNEARRAYDDFSRPDVGDPSPRSVRGRSPSRRFRSPSPYRQASQSPARRNEEN